MDWNAANIFIQSQINNNKMQLSMEQQQKYVNDVSSLSRANYYVRTPQNIQTQCYITSMVSSIQGTKPTEIVQEGVICDLYTSGTTTAANTQAHNNNLSFTGMSNCSSISSFSPSPEMQIVSCNNPSVALINALPAFEPSSQQLLDNSPGTVWHQ
eukprot:13971223-Ditylum_brightwellii.AAC.2